MAGTGSAGMSGAGTGGSGAAGIAGTSGQAGSGQAGQAGTSGTAGQAGSAGSGSMGGSSGSAGASGAGQAGMGSSGNGGTSGQAGSAGQAGTGQICTPGTICRAANGSGCDQPELFNQDCSCPQDANKQDGAPCGDGSSATCDSPDSCLKGVCKPNHTQAGVTCVDDGKDCTNDFCDGAGACTHPNKADGVSCGSPAASSCDNPDSCKVGVCQPNYKSFGTSCDTDSNPCTANICNGTGSCQTTAAPITTVCRAATCAAGMLTSEASCGGSTTCPASSTTSCNGGGCDSSGQACEFPDISPISASTIPPFIDNDATSLYMLRSGNLGKVSKTAVNGTPTTLLSGVTLMYPRAVLVAGGFVYFSVDGTGIQRVSVNGGTARTIITIPSGYTPVRLASDGSYLYWVQGTSQGNTCSCTRTAGQGDAIYRVPLSATTETTATLLYPLNSNYQVSEISPTIYVSDQHVYFLERTYTVSGYQAEVKKFDKNVGGMGGASPDESYVLGYYLNSVFKLFTVTDVLAGTPNSIKLLTASQGAPYLLGTLPVQSQGLAQADFTYTTVPNDITGLYPFITDTAGRSYYYNRKYPADGSANAPVFVPHDVVDLTQDSTYVYFSSYGYWTSPPYNITRTVDVAAPGVYRVAK